MTEWSDVIFVIGAVLVIAHAMVGGYKLHLVVIAHAPGIAAYLPRDAGAIAGLALGVLTVVAWTT
jgi:hypothetical protein